MPPQNIAAMICQERDEEKCQKNQSIANITMNIDGVAQV